MPATLQVDHVGPSSSYYVPIIVIMSIAISIIILSAVITIFNWKCRMMQLTQPIFTLCSLTGCILLCISCLVFLGSNSDINCSARAYLFNFSFTIAFSPLLIKGWRVYSVFVRSWKVNVLFHGSKSKPINVYELAIGILIFLTVDVIVMCVTLYGSNNKGTKPYVKMVKTNNGAYADLTYCGYHGNNHSFFSMLGYKGLLILAACVLSIQIRKISDAVAGTKVLVAIVYNTLFIGIIVISLVRTVTSVELIIFASCMGVAFCVVIACGFLVVPVMTRIIFTGDKEAAGEVIDEMFDAKTASEKKEARLESDTVFMTDFCNFCLMLFGFTQKEQVKVVRFVSTASRHQAPSQIENKNVLQTYTNNKRSALGFGSHAAMRGESYAMADR